MTTEDLASVTVGDSVAVYRGFTSRPSSIHPVVRVTAKQIVLGSLGNGTDWRFWRETGYEVGADGYYKCRIKAVTESIRQDVQRQRAIDDLSNKQWAALDTDTLLAVWALVQTQTT